MLRLHGIRPVSKNETLQSSTKKGIVVITMAFTVESSSFVVCLWLFVTVSTDIELSCDKQDKTTLSLQVPKNRSLSLIHLDYSQKIFDSQHICLQQPNN